MLGTRGRARRAGALFLFGLLLAIAACGDIKEPDELCCKVCLEGRACGDTCIASTSRCERPAGCACNVPAAD